MRKSARQRIAGMAVSAGTAVVLTGLHFGWPLTGTVAGLFLLGLGVGMGGDSE